MSACVPLARNSVLTNWDNGSLSTFRAALEGYGVEIVFIFVAHGPPIARCGAIFCDTARQTPPIARHGAIFCEIAIRSPPITARTPGNLKPGLDAVRP